MKLGDCQLCHNGCQFSWYDNDELVAMVELKEENGIKWICGVYVSPSYRHHGIGMQLLQFSTILGGEKLRVSKSNEVAKTLYKKFGFHVFDEDKEYLFMRLETLKDGSTTD